MPLVELICPICGAKHTKTQCEINRRIAENPNYQSYCSRSCAGKKVSTNLPDRQKTQYKNLICKNCSKEFTIPNNEFIYKSKKGQVNFFCCSTCARSYKCNKECSNCKKDIDKKLENVLGNFCSTECHHEWWNNKNNQTKVDKNYKDTDGLTPFIIHIRKILNRQINKEKELEISPQYLKEIWEKQEGKCPYSGVKLLLQEKRSNKHPRNPYNASIDRINNNKGYVPGNIEFVSLMAQYAKNTFTKEELIEFCKRVTENNSS